MSCDISDPSITEAYKQVLDGEASWLLLGYMDTREKLFLYQKGHGGIDELREQMSDPILYALLHYKDQLIYIVFVDENLSGVRRARTVVHGRTVASFFDQHDVHVYLNKMENLTQETIEQHIANKGIILPNDAPKSGKSVKSVKSTRSEAKVLTATNSFTKIPTLDHPIGSDSIGESSQLFNSADVTASFIDVGRSSPEDSLVVKIQSSTKPEVIPQKQESPESQGLLEVEAKRKIQEAWKNRESVRMQFDHTQGSGEGSQLSGYITIQGGGCCFWKRRWFVLKGETLYFYRDPLDRYPVSCLDLGGAQVDIADSSLETLIPHCFKLSLRKDAKDEVYQMFSDSDKHKSLTVAGILECTKG